MSCAEQQSTAAFCYDETLHPDGSMLPGWQSLLTHIKELSTDQIERRERDIVRQMRANGLAYHPETGNADSGRPWTLDLIPMLFEKAAWDALSKGLNQRARLKQALYQDIYGEQQLLKDGTIPPSMLYSHHGYLRDLVNPDASEPVSSRLPMYSCDVSRSPSGEWLVVDDICQYPAGIGYALENRIVLARVLPRRFKEYRVRRIVTYFRQLQRYIQGNSTAPARCVLLSYPPSHPHYFEFAWLAKYLGYPLVEPADLTVRDNRVFIKTITGLQLVEVIVRLINDAEIDPLVIGSTSSQGVPGIVEAARRGGVRILNPMGAGVLDNPAFNSILPQICEQLLDEPLLLQSPPTYWLGEQTQYRHVLSRIDQLLFRHVDSLGQLLDPLLLSETEKSRLIDKINLTPAAYVAQERVDRSVAPSLHHAEFVQKQITIRTFQVATETGYEPMPGGLCLLDTISGGSRPVMEGLAGSKDVWVLSNEPVQEDTLLDAYVDPANYGPHDDELPSRIAESVFWLGRNSERVESALRLLRNILQHLLDDDRPVQATLESPAMQCLLRSVTAVTGTLPGFLGRGGKKRLTQPDRELISLLQDSTRIGSLANSLQQWQLSASAVSDRLSADQLRVFTRLSDLQSALAVLELPADLSADNGALSQTIEVLDELQLLTSASTGLGHENVTHSESWQFMMLGKRIERAHQISVTVNTVMSVDRSNQRVLETLLRLFDSVMTYRSRYRSGLDNRRVLQLLLLDEINPRSLAYQFKHICELIDALPGRRVSGSIDPISRLAVAGLSRVRLAEPQALLDEDRDARQNLHKFLKVLQQLPASMADAITAQYFTHSEKAQNLGSFRVPPTGLLKAINSSERSGEDS
ncbi:hypothetical protein AB833_27695 [Chromatiales bacterium (ex Bugula neritina AB1)]|nr:hypothetical protein AB833_27695 [Chromatiales bacterium (ex Bugula neritina AB1)]